MCQKMYFLKILYKTLNLLDVCFFALCNAHDTPPWFGNRILAKKTAFKDFLNAQIEEKTASAEDQIACTWIEHPYQTKYIFFNLWRYFNFISRLQNQLMISPI